MGWAVGWDYSTARFRGYGVPSICEQPECDKLINRGMAYACEMEDCGRFFCEDHLYSNLGLYCERCLHADDPASIPFPVKPETKLWLKHVLKDKSWAQWRKERPEMVKEYRRQLKEAEK